MHSLRVPGRVVAAGKSPVCWRWLAWSVHTGLLCLRATAIVSRNVNLITLLRKWRQEWVCSLHINCRYVLMKWTAGLFIYIYQLYLQPSTVPTYFPGLQ